MAITKVVLNYGATKEGEKVFVTCMLQCTIRFAHEIGFNATAYEVFDKAITAMCPDVFKPNVPIMGTFGEYTVPYTPRFSWCRAFSEVVVADRVAVEFVNDGSAQTLRAASGSLNISFSVKSATTTPTSVVEVKATADDALAAFRLLEPLIRAFREAGRGDVNYQLSRHALS